MAYGCPVGTLCNELAKLDHIAKNESTNLFNLFRDWRSRQFAALGRETDADAVAMHIRTRSQGAAALATAFRDEDFFRREVEEMCEWLAAQCPTPFDQPETVSVQNA